MAPPVHFELTATADAMATTEVAGIGGVVFVPDGSCTWFQVKINLDEAKTLWTWCGSDMQKHIAAWELLAQYALTYCIHTALPNCRHAISCIQGTDNSAADAASAKGLSMTPAMAMVLAPFFAFMRRYQIYPKITHIPGHLNDIADALSRFKQPLPEPLTLSNQCEVRWQTLLDSASVFTAQSGRRWPHLFALTKNGVCRVRRLRVHQSIVCWGVCSGWSIFDPYWCFGTPHFTYNLFTTPASG